MADALLRIENMIRQWMREDDGDATEEELDIVAMAFDELMVTDDTAMEKIAFYKRIFDDDMTLAAAADEAHISYSTAKRWKHQIVDLVEWGLPE